MPLGCFKMLAYETFGKTYFLLFEMPDSFLLLLRVMLATICVSISVSSLFLSISLNFVNLNIFLNLSSSLLLGQQVHVFVCHFQPLPGYLIFPIDCWIYHKSRLMMTLTLLQHELPAGFH